MGTLPARSIPSIGSQIQGIKIQDKTEKALMVRIGTLIDAVVNSQRGHANAGAKLDRRSQAINAKRPAKVFGETENVFNGASVTIDPIRSTAGLSNYEIQIDSDPNFSDPDTKVAFNKNIIFKGLDAGVTYYIRVRALTKGGQVGPWNNLDPVITTVSNGATTADFDGTLGDQGRDSKIFTFNFVSEDLFTATNLGLQWLRQGGGDDDEAGPVDWQGGNPVTFPAGVTSTDWHVSAYDAMIQTVTGQSYKEVTLSPPGLTVDTSGVDYDINYGEIIRYWPIMLFDLFNFASETAALTSGNVVPVVPFLDFFHVDGRVSDLPAVPPKWESELESPTQNPVVWVKF